MLWYMGDMFLSYMIYCGQYQACSTLAKPANCILPIGNCATKPVILTHQVTPSRMDRLIVKDFHSDISSSGIPTPSHLVSLSLLDQT